MRIFSSTRLTGCYKSIHLEAALMRLLVENVSFFYL